MDTDGDGISDGEEVNGWPRSNPLLADSDGDGASDSLERRFRVEWTRHSSHIGFSWIAGAALVAAGLRSTRRERGGALVERGPLPSVARAAPAQFHLDKPRPPLLMVPLLRSRETP